MYVYKTTNLINGKIYIGQSNKDPDKSKSYYGSGTLFLRAFSKYGRASFVKEILCECATQKLLNTWEQIYIRKFNSTDINIGYNILKKDIGSHTAGKKMTEEELVEHSKRFKGMKRSDKAKANLSRSKLGENNPNYGRVYTTEERLKFASKGESHPLFGSTFMWVNNGIINKRLSLESEIPEGFKRGFKQQGNAVR